MAGRQLTGVYFCVSNCDYCSAAVSLSASVVVYTGGEVFVTKFLARRCGVDFVTNTRFLVTRC